MNTESRGRWDERRNEATPDWYYVRVTQHNGQLAWSSPIWIGCTAAVTARSSAALFTSAICGVTRSGQQPRDKKVERYRNRLLRMLLDGSSLV